MHKPGQPQRSSRSGPGKWFFAGLVLLTCVLLSGSAVIPPLLPAAAWPQQDPALRLAATEHDPVLFDVSTLKRATESAGTATPSTAPLVWVEMEFAQLSETIAAPVDVATALTSVWSATQILSRAAQGDMEAAFELGSAWRLCQGYLADAVIDPQKLLKDLQQPSVQARLAEMRLSAEEVIALTSEHQDRQSERCPQLMAVLDAMGEEDARHWLTLAAQGGHHDALRESAALELDMLKRLRASPGLQTEHDQRALSARTHIEQALMRGDSEALALRARMRLGDNLSGASREARLAAYADLLAYEALRPVSNQPHTHSALLRQLAVGLDAAGLLEAGEQAVQVGLELGAQAETIANAP